MAVTIILGSSRSDGNTNVIVDSFVRKCHAIKIDLLDYTIGRYDYHQKYADDDFIPLISRIVEQSDAVVLATPVYWYSMSGIMKNFVDRLTDCVTVRKDIGRNMKDLQMGLISCGSEEALLSSFEDPFRETAGYLEMKFAGHCHTWLEANKIPLEVDNRLTSLADTLIH